MASMMNLLKFAINRWVCDFKPVSLWFKTWCFAKKRSCLSNNLTLRRKGMGRTRQNAVKNLNNSLLSTHI